MFLTRQLPACGSSPRAGPASPISGRRAGVLDRWPVPLKGYRYRFQVVDADDVNAFAVPTGYVFVTRGLLESLETDEELAAILAHAIAHVESRHSHRQWRNARNMSIVVFQGFDDDGRLVATLRFDVQRLFRRELDVVATLSTTAELGDEDNVNTLSIWVGSATVGSRARQASGRRVRLRERTAERSSRATRSRLFSVTTMRAA